MSNLFAAVSRSASRNVSTPTRTEVLKRTRIITLIRQSHIFRKSASFVSPKKEESTAQINSEQYMINYQSNIRPSSHQNLTLLQQTASPTTTLAL
jgi:hypothetical protein